MTVRKTSLAAYDLVKPTLGERQKAVLDAILISGAATDLEIATYLNWPINTVTPRRGELVELGLVHKRGEITQNGRAATTWGCDAPRAVSAATPKPGELF